MKLSLTALCIVVVLLGTQDGKKQDTKRQDAGKTPPELPKLDPDPLPGKPGDQAAAGRRRSADLPFVNTSPGPDLIQRFPQNNPFLGVWSVIRIVNPAAPTARGRGYLVFTRGHLSMHLYLSGPTAGARPRFESSMRTYRVEGGQIVTTSLLGVRNSKRQGEILLSGNGLVQRRRFLFHGGNMLRIYQGAQSWIELKRVEAF